MSAHRGARLRRSGGCTHLKKKNLNRAFKVSILENRWRKRHRYTGDKSGG